MRKWNLSSYARDPCALLTAYCFSDHIAELNSARPKQPFYFLKPTSSILLPGEGPVKRPKGVELSYEVELALIIGKTVKDFPVEDEAGAIDAIESRCPTYLLTAIYD
jgi:acylpyruvate hydrolase